MSGQFWRFGNTNKESSPINMLLENAFIDNDSRSRSRSRSPSARKNTRSFGFNNYTDEEDEDDDNESREESSVPNLDILAKLLDENEILEELLGSNIKLIQYLRSRDVLLQLVRYVITCDDYKQFANGSNEFQVGAQDKEELMEKETVTTESSTDERDQEEQETPEQTHARRAHVCTEILSADAWSLTDTFMDNTDLLALLWNLLDLPAPWSTSLSAHFMKINEHLLDSKTDEMLNFLLQQSNIADSFLRHIDNPALMDFLLKVISTDKPDNSSGIIDLLKEQDLINKLIAFLRPDINPGIQSAAGDFIKALVTISANSNADNSTVGPNELTRDLVSESTMEELSDLMLMGGTSLSNGVGIIIEIIRKNNSDYDYVPVLYTTLDSHPPNSRDPIYLGHLIKVFSKKIPQFSAILQHHKKPSLETPFGVIEPLGFERFKICELIAELLHCSNMGLLNDEAGEAIVRERDLERIAVLEMHKQEMARERQRLPGHEMSFPEDEEDDVSREINRLSISSDSSNDVFQESNESPQSDSNITQEDIDISLEIADRETLKDNEDDEQLQDVESKPTTTNALESEPDSDQEGSNNADLEFDENESSLRKQSIIGDQLKIALLDNKVIVTILKMFFRFPWNNFLHNVVFDIVQQILNGSMEIGYNKYLAIDLFGRGEITKLIIQGQKKCEEYEVETGLRLGYMGHLTLIAEEVVKFISLYPPVSIHSIIVSAVSTEEWDTYRHQTLVETREKYNALLGGEEEQEEGEDEEGEQIEIEDEEHQVHRGFILNPNVDHDITGSGYNDEENEEQNDENDMSDKFSRYMSQQINNDIPNKSSDEDDDEDEIQDEDHAISNWNNQQFHHHRSDQYTVHDDDDYEDPNDDGQSYTKKSHPLYNEMLSLNSTSNQHPHHHQFSEEAVIDESSSSSSSSGSSSESEDEEENQNNEGNGNENEGEQSSSGSATGYSLTRNKSKGEMMNWDDEEQDRLISMANYIKTHPHSSSGSNSPTSGN